MRAILTRAQLHALCISSAPLQFSSVNGLAALSMVFEILSNDPHHNKLCSVLMCWTMVYLVALSNDCGLGIVLRLSTSCFALRSQIETGFVRQV